MEYLKFHFKQGGDMKINQHNMLAGLLLVSMTFSSCLETHVTNRIDRDGSVHRTVVCKSDDSDDFSYSKFPVPVDESWMKTVTYELDTTPPEPGNIFPVKDTTWIYTYAKDFENAGEINNLYLTGNDRFNHVARRAEFSRKFNWFFSRILFSETIEPMVKGVNPLEFFTEEEYEVFLMNDAELQTFINHPDSVKRKDFVDQVEVRTEDWMTMCLAEDYLNRLADYAVSHNADIQKETILAKRDLFIEKVEDESDIPELTALIFDNAPEVLFGDGIIVFFEETERFYEQVFDIGGSSYTMDFVMPGILTYANGTIINKQRVSWDVSSERFFAIPFVMEAESRVINLWAWIVSAVFIVFVLTGLFKKKKAAL